ncbi:MAG TPA: glycine--tRNA ligase subunit beta, partial [Coriobacteriia bacterium]|nr:glycine--tRNA ligase subunit beta [Coriobacteriia bacterium]
MSRDLLFEIGVEEIPSAPLYSAVTQLEESVPAALKAARLGYSDVAVYGSPRRLAVLVRDLAERQDDVTLRHKGPAAKAAFDEAGAPTKAAVGFARGKGVAVTDLRVEEVEGGSYVFAVVDEPGRPALDVLPALLADLAASIDWPKSMRWGSGNARFIRPVRWLVALLGDTVVPVTFAGLAAGRTTLGHRFLGGSVELASAGEYLNALRGVRVVASQNERAVTLRDAIDLAATGAGGRAVVPEKTFGEVVNLVEWPTVAAGHFEEAYLEVPREVLEEAMESHQRYFPVEGAEGLLASFVVAHNGDPERTASIVAGHERVIRARLADAAFFYREDLKHPLEAYVERLDAIVFHEKLGTVGQKVRRVEALVRSLAGLTEAQADDEAYAVRAAYASSSACASVSPA